MTDDPSTGMTEPVRQAEARLITTFAGMVGKTIERVSGDEEGDYDIFILFTDGSVACFNGEEMGLVDSLYVSLDGAERAGLVTMEELRAEKHVRHSSGF
jgi:hypothetical protein